MIVVGEEKRIAVGVKQEEQRTVVEAFAFAVEASASAEGRIAVEASAFAVEAFAFAVEGRTVVEASASFAEEDPLKVYQQSFVLP